MSISCMLLGKMYKLVHVVLNTFITIPMRHECAHESLKTSPTLTPNSPPYGTAHYHK